MFLIYIQAYKYAYFNSMQYNWQTNTVNQQHFENKYITRNKNIKYKV
jgi:hypothetical protein